MKEDNQSLNLYNKAEALYKEGNYTLACNIMERIFIEQNNWQEDEIFLFARALKATSRYEEAFSILLLAQQNSINYCKGLIERADIAWILHRYEEGYSCAIEALRLNMFNRKAQQLRDRCRIGMETLSHLNLKGIQLFHAAFYMNKGGNFGDIVLPQTLRTCIQKFLPNINWQSMHVHQVVNEERLDAINSASGIIIGGGGLLLPDTAPNGNSGWQWNIPLHILQKVKVPLAVLAVGYNLFYGQKIYSHLFDRSLEMLVEKATVVGLRNHGSIKAVRQHLPEHLQEKVHFMPCPTTIIRHLYPQFRETPPMPSNAPIFLNIAFDREALRFGGRYQQFLDDMAWYINILKSSGLKVEYAAHLQTDERFVHDLEKNYKISLRVHGFYDMTPEEGYEIYRKAALVVGMRGHATMIPFGLGIPVLSIISHPKMLFFLEDIKRTEWGIYISSEQFIDNLLKTTLALINQNNKIRNDIINIQNDMYKSCSNIVTKFIEVIHNN